MKIALDTKENLEIDYTNGCPRCHGSYNKKKRKKTKHHVLPKFLDPKTEVTITICESCHNELNSFYKSTKIIAIKSQVTSTNWEEFEQNYHLLRGEYHEKKINRGQFGEGLWSNLMSYLGSKEEK